MSTPRTVLLMTDEIDVGGKRSYVDILKAGLEQIGWRVHLLNWSSLSWPERAWGGGGFRVLNSLSGGLGYRWLTPAARRFLGSRVRAILRGPAPPDVIHVQEPLTYVAARAGAGATPVVMTVHGRLAKELRLGAGLPAGHPNARYVEDLERIAFCGADRLAAVEELLVGHVREFAPGRSVEVLTNFIDTRSFNPGVSPEPFAPGIERWIAGRPVAFSASRLSATKGLDVAMRAARILADRGRSVAFVVAGDGPQRAELEALSREIGAGDVFLLAGEIPHDRLPGLYRRVDCLVSPSVPLQGNVEGSSIAALESLAAGRPLIASAIGGLREMIEHGVNGLHVPPGDPAALADAVVLLLDHPERAAALGTAAAERIERERSHLHGARRYAEFYSGAIEAAARRGGNPQ